MPLRCQTLMLLELKSNQKPVIQRNKLPDFNTMITVLSAVFKKKFVE